MRNFTPWYRPKLRYRFKNCKSARREHHLARAYWTFSGYRHFARLLVNVNQRFRNISNSTRVPAVRPVSLRQRYQGGITCLFSVVVECSAGEPKAGYRQSAMAIAVTTLLMKLPYVIRNEVRVRCKPVAHTHTAVWQMY